MHRQNGKTSSLSDKAEAAFDQAAQEVVRRAKQSGTPIVVWKDGHIAEIPGEQAEIVTVKGKPNAAS